MSLGSPALRRWDAYQFDFRSAAANRSHIFSASLFQDLVYFHAACYQALTNQNLRTASMSSEKYRKQYTLIRYLGCR